MVEKIDHTKLSFHLWRTGPYIHFFNGNCEGFNKELVTIMNKMAVKYYCIKIFEIDWKKKKEDAPIIPDVVMDTIYMHFQGRLTDELLRPNKTQINELLKKAVDFYNEHIEILSKNVGIRNRHKRIENIPSNKKESGYDYIQHKRKLLLKKKIFFKNGKITSLMKIQNDLISEKNKNNPIQIKKTINKVTEPQIKKKYNKNTKTIFNLSQEWFCDVEITELPFDIFEETHTLNSSKNLKNSNKEEKIPSDLEKRKFKLQYLNNRRVKAKSCLRDMMLSNKLSSPDVKQKAMIDYEEYMKTLNQFHNRFRNILPKPDHKSTIVLSKNNNLVSNNTYVSLKQKPLIINNQESLNLHIQNDHNYNSSFFRYQIIKF